MAIPVRVDFRPPQLCDSLAEISTLTKEPMLKRFKDLSEKEILALAITSEEEDGRIYGAFADALRESYPATRKCLKRMRTEEAGHRDRLLALFRQRFGDHIPPIRREDVRGFLQRRPVWMMRPLGVKVARASGNHGDGSQPLLFPRRQPYLRRATCANC